MAAKRPVDGYTGNRLIGDLHSTPDPMRRLVDQDVYAMEWARTMAAPDQYSQIDEMIKTLTTVVRCSLEKADPFLDALVRTKVNHQMRTRPDLETGETIVEQWIPALRCWLVNGKFQPDVPTWEIVKVLQAGDPTKETPEEALERKRGEAAVQREKNEKAGDQKVLDVVNSLSDKRLNQFVEVERALQTGESITVREDDRRQIETLVENTRKAAAKGDKESQEVITNGGVTDNRTCILPPTNPFRHRHRAELEGKKEA